MTKDDLLKKLKYISEVNDPEWQHLRADEALLEFINDTEIKEAFDSIDKWYA